MYQFGRFVLNEGDENKYPFWRQTNDTCEKRWPCMRQSSECMYVSGVVVSFSLLACAYAGTAEENLARPAGVSSSANCRQWVKLVLGLYSPFLRRLRGRSTAPWH